MRDLAENTKQAYERQLKQFGISHSVNIRFPGVVIHLPRLLIFTGSSNRYAAAVVLLSASQSGSITQKVRNICKKRLQILQANINIYLN